MKYLKMAGLAAVAAMAFMAFGAGTASATTLCTQTESPCAAGNQITTTQDSHIVAELTHGELFTTNNTGNPLVTCTDGSMTATVEDPGSSTTTAKAQINSLVFTGCHTGGVPTVIKPGTLEIHHIAGTHNGTVTAKNAEITVNIFGVSCTYGATGEAAIDLGILETSTLTINTVVNKIAGGFLCPSTAGWDTSGHLVGGANTPSVIYVGP